MEVTEWVVPVSFNTRQRSTGGKELVNLKKKKGMLLQLAKSSHAIHGGAYFSTICG